MSRLDLLTEVYSELSLEGSDNSEGAHVSYNLTAGNNMEEPSDSPEPIFNTTNDKLNETNELLLKIAEKSEKNSLALSKLEKNSEKLIELLEEQSKMDSMQEDPADVTIMQKIRKVFMKTSQWVGNFLLGFLSFGSTMNFIGSAYKYFYPKLTRPPAGGGSTLLQGFFNLWPFHQQNTSQFSDNGDDSLAFTGRLTPSASANDLPIINQPVSGVTSD